MAVAPSADAAQLRETLAQYEAQLHQVSLVHGPLSVLCVRSCLCR